MVEFTDREIKIIHTMNVLRNPQLIGKTPPEVMKTIVTGTLLVRGIKFEEQEIIDLIEGVTDEVNLSVQNAMGFIHKHQGMFKDFAALKLFKT
ncbi:MAG: hypothetical protein ACHQW9_00050 [Nitrososphaerales archaeon]